MFLTDDAVLWAMLREDVPHGDLTLRAMGLGREPGRLTMAARDPMTVAASEEAARMFGLLGCAVRLEAPSGTRAAPGTPILAAEGPAEAIFAGWKVAQTLVEWASGIASAAAAMVGAAADVRPGTLIACTRKTVPGTRTLSYKAACSGGAAIHRTGLSDTVLVFPEYAGFAAGSLEGQLARIRAACPERRVVAEVGSVAAALAAAEAGADVVQLEKFALSDIAAVVTALSGRPVAVAAAGGINPGNAADYAATGAAILVTSAPYTAKPRDVQVRLTPL